MLRNVVVSFFPNSEVDVEELQSCCFFCGKEFEDVIVEHGHTVIDHEEIIHGTNFTVHESGEEGAFEAKYRQRHLTLHYIDQLIKQGFV